MTAALADPVDPDDVGLPDHTLGVVIVPVTVRHRIACPTCRYPIRQADAANYWDDGEIRHAECRP